MTKSVEAGNPSLTLADVARVAREKTPVSLAASCLPKLQKSRSVVERYVNEKKIAYGITTGFGKLADTSIDPTQNQELQTNLLLSTAIGVGENFPEDVVRGMMFLRLQSLALGYSGVRPQVVDHLLRFLNENVCPLIPSQGSVGASGDLAPLAHLGLALLGIGEVDFHGKRMPAEEALRVLKLTPLKLEAKEGLGLINGTQAMTALSALALFDSAALLKVATIAAAMSLEAALAADSFLDDRLQKLRPHPGQIQVAENLRKITQASKLVASHKASLHRIQDAYSIRCIPQVHGPIQEAYRYAKKVTETEINAVTDNPLVLPEHDEIVAGGNFHGHPIALSSDFFKIALVGLSNISERRVERLLNPALSEGLPPFLTRHSGIDSGMMVCQYTAAALVSENKTLSHPASVDSIPTSANQEDYNSMGTIAARSLTQVVRNTKIVLAIELMCAAQALEFRRPLTFGKGVEAAFAVLRKKVPMLDKDRWLKPDLEATVELVENGEIVRAVETSVGSILI